LNITGMVHVNINCRDYEKSKAFYEMLGFEEFWPVPETNSEEVANAVAMPVYKVKGALMTLTGATQRTIIDLLEFFFAKCANHRNINSRKIQSIIHSQPRSFS